MILAIVIAAQLATTSANPCADQLAELCKISPYFCAGAYPANLVPGTNGIPCWSPRSVAPATHASSPTRRTNSIDRRTSANQQATPETTARSGASEETVRERFARALQRLVRTSSP